MESSSIHKVLQRNTGPLQCFILITEKVKCRNTKMQKLENQYIYVENRKIEENTEFRVQNLTFIHICTQILVIFFLFIFSIEKIIQKDMLVICVIPYNRLRLHTGDFMKMFSQLPVCTRK